MTRLAFWFLLTAGMAGLVQANYLRIKAVVAQHLIQQTWSDLQVATQSGDGRAVKPWWWADFTPVAKLSWQSHEVYVLSSTSGDALAFGPGHLNSSAAPGAPGRSIIAGHNDSHFAFLESLQSGDALELVSVHGDENVYTVTAMDIVDSRDHALLHSDKDELLLVTCYPFRSLRRDTPWRLVISAEKQRESV